VTQLHCSIEPGPVVIRIGDAALPPATVQAELPGGEYIRVFDLVHAAVLRWSPNVTAAAPVPVPGLSGAPSDCPVEDAIDALTYALVIHRSELATPTTIDPHVVAAVTAMAARAPDAPDSASIWEGCLRQSLEVYDAVSSRGVRHISVDLEQGRLHTTPS
jgi:hypothetical protein